MKYIQTNLLIINILLLYINERELLQQIRFFLNNNRIK